MQVHVNKGKKGWYGLRPDEDIQVLRSRLMHFVKHQFSWDTSLWAVQLTGSPLKRSHILLYDLVEEHGRQLGVQQRAELKGYLLKYKKESCL